MTQSRLPLLAVLGVFVVAVSARAGDDRPTAAVRDEARLFSPEARQKADEEIADIKKVYHLDFILETASAAPEEVKKQLQTAKTNAQKTQILQAWGATGRSRRFGRRLRPGLQGRRSRLVRPGVRLRRCGGRAEALGRAITAVDAKALHDRLVWFTRGQDTAKNDKILHNAVEQVREDLSYNLRPPFPWLPVGGVFLSVLGLWGILGLVRQRLQGAPSRGRRSRGGWSCSAVCSAACSGPSPDIGFMIAYLSPHRVPRPRRTDYGRGGVAPGRSERHGTRADRRRAAGFGGARHDIRLAATRRGALRTALPFGSRLNAARKRRPHEPGRLPVLPQAGRPRRPASRGRGLALPTWRRPAGAVAGLPRLLSADRPAARHGIEWPGRRGTASVSRRNVSSGPRDRGRLPAA